MAPMLWLLLLLGIWLALNAAFVAVRLYVAAETTTDQVPRRYPQLVS
jgi:hypothetical protein